MDLTGFSAIALAKKIQAKEISVGSGQGYACPDREKRAGYPQLYHG